MCIGKHVLSCEAHHFFGAYLDVIQCMKWQLDIMDISSECTPVKQKQKKMQAAFMHLTCTQERVARIVFAR